MRVRTSRGWWLEVTSFPRFEPGATSKSMTQMCHECHIKVFVA
jgi:hypothetical protein